MKRSLSHAFAFSIASIACFAHPSIQVKLKPDSVTLRPGHSAIFHAIVSGTHKNAVTWMASGGQLRPYGSFAYFIAPKTPGVYTLTATSKADPTKSDTSTITVPGVVVTPPTATLLSGATQPFSAVVTGSSNTAVNWSVQESNGGTVSTSGLYMAPTVSATTTFHVIATSQAHLSERAMATVTVNPPPETGTATISILETTDLHANVLSYDYFKLAEDKSIGLERTATLIKAAKVENPNTILLDGGDTIQGTALADYQALVNPVATDQNLAIYKVMSTMGYDGGTVGNHEFNYGLSYLSRVTGLKFDVDGVDPAQPICSGPNFPLVTSNILSTKTNAPLFQPYTIITKTIHTLKSDGTWVERPLHVGLIGFTPPGITTWDKRWLDGKVTTIGIKEAAEKYVPEMRAKGADIVIAISHGGISASPYSPDMENGNYYLAQVPGIDALLTGHSHLVFPGTAYQNIPNVDAQKGTIFGVPTVMAGYWGKQMGKIKLGLVKNGTTWTVDTSQTSVQVVSTLLDPANKIYVAPDPTIAPLIDAEHQATIAYVKTPIGSSDFPMTTHFADVGDPAAIQIVNQAQADYVNQYIKNNLPQYTSLPVLSVSAPFKCGFGGGNDYTDVAMGDLAINNAADLYLYPNTIYAVKVTGDDIKAWLEKAATRFNQIDPANVNPQNLVSTFPGYNFDMFTSADIQYEIDVAQAVGSRIKNLNYKGAPIVGSQEFVIATNNYRAGGGGGFTMLNSSKIIIASPDNNRDVLIQYIKSVKTLTRAINGSDRSWKFTKATTAGPITFKSAQNKLDIAQAAGLTNVSLFQADDGTGTGMAVYSIDLNQ